MSEFHPTRRALLAGGAAVLAATSVPVAAQPMPGDEVVLLWSGAIPGDQHAKIVQKVADQSHDPAHPDRFLTGIARPVLVVKRPAQPNGAAMLIIPGGGYGSLSYDNEGTSQASWMPLRSRRELTQ